MHLIVWGSRCCMFACTTSLKNHLFSKTNTIFNDILKYFSIKYIILGRKSIVLVGLSQVITLEETSGWIIDRFLINSTGLPIEFHEWYGQERKIGDSFKVLAQIIFWEGHAQSMWKFPGQESTLAITYLQQRLILNPLCLNGNSS